MILISTSIAHGQWATLQTKRNDALLGGLELAIGDFIEGGEVGDTPAAVLSALVVDGWLAPQDGDKGEKVEEAVVLSVIAEVLAHAEAVRLAEQAFDADDYDAYDCDLPDDRVQALKAEALQAGDLVMAELCALAEGPSGHEGAMYLLWKAAEAAEAMNDEGDDEGNDKGDEEGDEEGDDEDLLAEGMRKLEDPELDFDTVTYLDRNAGGRFRSSVQDVVELGAEKMTYGEWCSLYPGDPVED